MTTLTGTVLGHAADAHALAATVATVPATGGRGGRAGVVVAAGRLPALRRHGAAAWRPAHRPVGAPARRRHAGRVVRLRRDRLLHPARRRQPEPGPAPVLVDPGGGLPG